MVASLTCDTSARTLTSTERNHLLGRLGCAAVHPDGAGLAWLQRAWLFHQPFHNLDLLAATWTHRGSLSADEAVQRCLDLHGGPCHVQALGFLALVRSIGFDAGLCGATIGHPDDHLLVRVAVGGATWLCDVGNGQPYVEPFPLERGHVQHHLGWEMRTTALSGGLRLERRSPDQPAWRTVYAADARPRAWHEFAATIERHHAEPGFGPFLTGLRAVRIGATEMVTLRDNVVTTYGHAGYQRDDLASEDIAAWLTGPMRMADLPVQAAIAAWQAARSAV